MNWNAINFDWNQIRAFLATAEEGSLSAAARALGQTQPTLSRQLTALEESLGVQLLERGKRHQRVTPAGAALLEHVTTMRDAALKISHLASAQSDQMDGDVTISTTDTVATQLMPPILKQLRHIAPRVNINLLSSADMRELETREADIAIRHVAPDNSDLIARRLFDTHAGLYVAQSYINQCGGSISQDNLATVDFIGMEGFQRFLPLLETLNTGITESQFKLVTSNSAAMIELLRLGAGVSFLMKPIAQKIPELVPIVPDVRVDVPFWIIVHKELRRNRLIKTVFDHIAASFSDS